jgi:hypothetical protein
MPFGTGQEPREIIWNAGMEKYIYLLTYGAGRHPQERNAPFLKVALS